MGIPKTFPQAYTVTLICAHARTRTHTRVHTLAKAVPDLPASSLRDVSEVTSFDGMFVAASAFNQDISPW